MSDNIFLFNMDDYKRDLDPVNHYIEIASNYIATVKGIDIEYVKTKLKEMINTRSGPFSGIKNRPIKHTSRIDSSDRVVASQSLLDYVNMIKNKNLIVAPTLTTYLRHDVKNALSNDFITTNKKNRSVYKVKKLEYKAKGDKVMANYYHNYQDNMKRDNNAYSGALSSPHTALFNKTGHSTLTSVTRMSTSTSNSTTEKLLTGNRHYFSIDIIINNIVYIVSQTPSNLKDTMDKYNLKVLSIKDCKDIILESSQLYSIRNIDEVDSYLDKLDPYQLSWFGYCNDLYHLYIHNKDILDSILKNFMYKKESTNDYKVDDIYKYPSEYIMLGHHICLNDIKGLGVEYDAMIEKGVFNGLVETVKHTYESMQLYSDLFNVFFCNNVNAHNVANFPVSLRKAVLTSDTDSTIFTAQELIFNILGNKEFSEQGLNLYSYLMLIVTYVVKHQLIKMSAQYNTVKDKLKEISMKNEFTFPVYCTTGYGKHYYASIAVQEGMVYKKLEREFKGVQLVSSNLPAKIRDGAKDMMNDIMDKCLANQELSINEYLFKIKAIEQDIIDSIKSGDIEYFKRFKINGVASYDQSKFNNYMYFTLWNMVLGDIYTPIETTPYTAFKISTTLVNKTSLALWVESLDPELQPKLKMWLKETGRTDLPILLLPVDKVRSYGLPKEILPIIDFKHMVRELCSIYYIVLESIGFYIKTGYIISDYFTEA